MIWESRDKDLLYSQCCIDSCVEWMCVCTVSCWQPVLLLAGFSDSRCASIVECCNLKCHILFIELYIINYIEMPSCDFTRRFKYCLSATFITLNRYNNSFRHNSIVLTVTFLTSYCIRTCCQTVSLFINSVVLVVNEDVWILCQVIIIRMPYVS